MKLNNLLECLEREATQSMKDCNPKMLNEREMASLAAASSAVSLKRIATALECLAYGDNQHRSLGDVR